MRVARLKMVNFRGVKEAELSFEGHTLMIGPNNVGKSTICEALDLVLGPDRLNRFPAVEEFDFYNARYLEEAKAENEPPIPVPIRIEVVLLDLTPEIENRCGNHLEFWRVSEGRVLIPGEAEAANPPDVKTCLRLETVARYNPEEDEFEAQTYFSHSPQAEETELTPVRKEIKRLFGFLYLRALRTGSRALSLERGSLLDIILRLKAVRTGVWEKTISRLRTLDIEKDATGLEMVLKSIERRLAQYIPSEVAGRTTSLHVSQLTREHLRKTIAFFLSLAKDQDPVPFQHAGTGTLNTLVLALLSFIAELKPDTVIFAMEEPEIALPPHTQRRIADYLLNNTTQAFVTSHSPYVIERFDSSQTLLLVRGQDSKLECKRVSDASGLKDNDYKRYARRGLTECILGKGAVVVEGLTEYHALPVAARKIEAAYPDFMPLDIAGVCFFDAESDGPMPKFGTFFKALGLKTCSFYDYKQRSADEKQKFTASFDIDFEHKYVGFESLVAEEVPVNRLWTFLSGLLAAGENGKVGIPAQRPSDEQVKKIAKDALSSNKGAGWAARLFEECEFTELPGSVVTFLLLVYGFFPKPASDEEDSVVSPAKTSAAAASGTPGAGTQNG